jgi:hypothetical protein|tara:strand:- start:217 stop:354 length:138 start_codon:yes stop_codon:yes gene_type:complete
MIILFAITFILFILLYILIEIKTGQRENKKLEENINKYENLNGRL